MELITVVEKSLGIFIGTNLCVLEIVSGVDVKIVGSSVVLDTNRWVLEGVLRIEIVLECALRMELVEVLGSSVVIFSVVV